MNLWFFQGAKCWPISFAVIDLNENYLSVFIGVKGKILIKKSKIIFVYTGKNYFFTSSRHFTNFKFLSLARIPCKMEISLKKCFPPCKVDYNFSNCLDLTYKTYQGNFFKMNGVIPWKYQENENKVKVSDSFFSR